MVCLDIAGGTGQPNMSLGSWLGSAAHLAGVPYLHGVTSVAMAGTRCGLGHLGPSSAESSGGVCAKQQKSLLDCCLFLPIKEKICLLNN